MSGSGTAADPYIVADYADLKAVGITYGLDKVYRLAADIDASASRIENAGSGFIPIGTYGNPFTGVFHGAGHMIKNLFIYRPSIPFIGLFGYTTGATIDSLGISGGSETGSSFVGGLAGYATGNSTIRECYATCSIVASANYAGGLIGGNVNSAVNTCYSTGSVKGKNEIGGLIGHNDSSSTVLECYATASVRGEVYVGGLVGYNLTGGSISDCYAAGQVRGTGSTGGFAGANGTGSTIGGYGCLWDKEASGLSSGTGSNSGSANLYGFTTAQMKKSTNFSGWDFYSIWRIRTDSTYPGLRKLDNAPFAFVDSFSTKNGFSLEQLLLNDCDVETARLALILSIDSVALVTSGDTSTIFYRVGEIRSIDTLWGNIASAVFPVHFGTGTTDDPYLVGTYEGLKLVGTTYGLNKVYRLTADIDATASATERSDSGFVPIGTSTATFTGMFHGSGHVIRNLTINRPNANYVGLFGYIGTAGSVDSVGAVNVSVKGKYCIGAIAGYNRGTISNCYATGSVHNEAIAVSGTYIGGLVGNNYYGTITGSSAACSVTGSNQYVGGLAGYSYAASVTGCHASGTVVGNGNNVGGLIGCNSSGTVSQCYATGSVTGTRSQTGGLIGYNNSGTISECYATGSVIGLGTSMYVGGLIGRNGSTSVSRCYATGSVTADSMSSVGGLVGISTSTIDGCFATGDVKGSSNVGGLVGQNAAGATVNRSHWDTQSGLSSGMGLNAGAVTWCGGLTTDQMRSSSNFSVWNFDTTWIIRTDSTYPGLRKLDNAPFAFADTFTTDRTFDLSNLLLNDCDIETAQSSLTLQIISVSQGTLDGVNTLTFADTAVYGSMATVTYRVGEIRTSDTLWGNIAAAAVTLDTAFVSGAGVSDKIPEEFALMQNFPNPFNPATTISYRLRHTDRVDLRVYDMLGREVAVLIQEKKPAGSYQVQWNAGGLPSGMYVYRMRTGTSLQTKRMLLLK